MSIRLKILLLVAFTALTMSVASVVAVLQLQQVRSWLDTVTTDAVQLDKDLSQMLGALNLLERDIDKLVYYGEFMHLDNDYRIIFDTYRAGIEHTFESISGRLPTIEKLAEQTRVGADTSIPGITMRDWPARIVWLDHDLTHYRQAVSDFIDAANARELDMDQKAYIRQELSSAATPVRRGLLEGSEQLADDIDTTIRASHRQKSHTLELVSILLALGLLLSLVSGWLTTTRITRLLRATAELASGLFPRNAVQDPASADESIVLHHALQSAKQALDEEAATRTELSTIIGNVLPGLARIDEYGRLSDISPEFAAMFVTDADELDGTPFRLLVDTGDQASIGETLAGAISTGSANIEVQLLSSVAAVQWCEVWIIRSERLAREKINCFVFLRDISERKHQEVLLQETRENMETLVQANPGVFYLLDSANRKTLKLSGRMQDMTGYTSEECLARPDFPQFMFHADDRDRVNQLMADVRHQEATLEYRIIHRNGEIRWVRDQYRGFLNAEGRFMVAGCVVDITDLKQNEQLLQQSQQSARMCHWQFYPQTREVKWSAMIYQLLEIDPQSITLDADSYNQFIHPDDLESVNRAQARAAADEIHLDHIYRIVRADGRTRYVHEIGVPEYDVIGQVVSVCGMLQDITEQYEREQTQAELLETIRANEQRLTHAQKIASLCFWEYYVDSDSMTWSDTVYELLGTEPGALDATGKGYYRYVHPDDLPQIKQRHDKVLAEGARLEGVHRIIRADGAIRYVHVVGVPNLDASGRVVSISGMNQDITEQHLREQTQQALLQTIRENEQRLKHAQAIANLGFWEHKVQDGSLYLSELACNILGFDPHRRDYVLGDFLDVVHPDDRARVAEYDEHTYRQQSELEQEYRIVQRNGEMRHIHERASISRAEDGKTLKLSGVIQDITAQKQVEQKLLQQKDQAEALVDEISREKALTEAIIDSLSGFFYMLDDEGRLLRCNRNVKVRFGGDTDELIGTRIGERVYDADQLARGKERFKQVLSGEMVEDEVKMIDRHGQADPYYITTQRCDIAGQTYIFASGIEITSLKQAQREVGRMARFLTENPAPVMRISATGELQVHNDAARLFMRQWRGQDWQRLSPLWRARIEEVLQQDETRRYELNLGSTSYMLNMVPVTDEAYVNIYAEEITELTRYRQSLELLVQQRTRDLGLIFDLSPDGFVSIDAENRVSYVNPAFVQMTGLAEDHIIGMRADDFYRHVAELVNPVGADTLDLPITESWQDRAIDVQWLRPRPRMVRQEMKSSYSDDGRLQGRVLYLRDVSHETEVSRIKSEFLSAAAHELRTPLASIYGYAELLMMKDYDEVHRRELIQTICQQCNGLVSLLNELLDLARIEARAGRDFDIRPCQLDSLVKDVVSSWMVPGDPRQPIVKVEADLPTVYADDEKLAQALRNVLANAYRYSSDGPVEITLLSRQQDGMQQAGIRVRDHGIGMNEREQAQAFVRFWRANKSGSTPGTGLGMSLVKEIMDVHNGEVQLWSREQEGTAVTLWLMTSLPATGDTGPVVQALPAPAQGSDADQSDEVDTTLV